MSESHEDQMLRRYLRQEAPSVSTDQGWLSMTSRLRARRIMRIARWPLFLIVFGGVFVWLAMLSSGGCAPGAPEFKAADLVQATIKNLYPAGGGAPVTAMIDLSQTAELDVFLAAYRSMKPAEETGRITSPDLYLNLTFRGNREIVVVLEKDVPQFVEIREYRDGKLSGTVHVRPGAMFGYMVGRSQVTWLAVPTLGPFANLTRYRPREPTEGTIRPEPDI